MGTAQSEGETTCNTRDVNLRRQFESRRLDQLVVSGAIAALECSASVFNQPQGRGDRAPRPGGLRFQ